MIDIELLNEFRGEVNTTGWCYYKYKNKNNRNQWNCICSAMDWIEVSAEYISSHPLASIGKYASIEVYSYLSCVDIIVEAVEQLHRVIFSTNKYVFEKDSECFTDNQFSQDDRTYFKTLRACFGAHPVNLSDPEESDINAKRFASWSGGYFGTENFSVLLYSNKVDGNSIILGMRFSQIEAFLAKYYAHLAALKEELRKQYNEFCIKKKKQKIEVSEEPIAQLEILKKESLERLNVDYYRITIDELLLLFKTPISCERNKKIVASYHEYLKTVVQEIYSNLQNMNLVDLKNDHLLIPTHDKLPNGWAYGYEKLCEAITGAGYPEFFWIDKIKTAFADKFVFEYTTIQELYVLVHASLYQLTQ